MRIDFPVRRGRRIQLTSLIDVIFLLLLFFMLSSTFSRFTFFELSTGRAGVSRSVEAPKILLRLKDGAFSINGAVATIEDAPDQLTALVADEPKTAVLMVMGETTSQDLVQWLETVQAIDGLTVTLVRQNR